MRRPEPRTLLWRALTALVALLIAALALGQVGHPPIAVPGSDKLHHALAFWALVLPAALLRWPRVGLVAVLAFLYGGLIEGLQPLFGRTRDLLDLLANGLGILVALGLGALRHRVRLRRGETALPGLRAEGAGRGEA